MTAGVQQTAQVRVRAKTHSSLLLGEKKKETHAHHFVCKPFPVTWFCQFPRTRIGIVRRMEYLGRGFSTLVFLVILVFTVAFPFLFHCN